jgi:RND family efflux transporter MFP subunit
MTFRFFPLAVTAGLSLLAIAGLSACHGGSSTAGAAGPGAPPVTVAAAAVAEVTDNDDFSGRFEAVNRVELRPRVSGYIDQARFTEGGLVKKGDVLFIIDPRPFDVALQRAQADLARVEASAALADSEAKRAATLLGSRAISQEEHDQRFSAQSQAKADLASARAAVAAAKLDLDYTRVVAPVAGRVSRAEITVGNYVTSGQDVLTSIVSVDPIYVVFEGDERSYLRLTGDGSARSVSIGLAGSEGFPYSGTLNFIDNAIDPRNGTLRTRAVLPNPDGRFVPGLFARVRVGSGAPHSAVLVPDTAIGTDQDRRFVLVVGSDNKVEHRPVSLGGVANGQRIILTGLSAGERVVISGLHRARPGSVVTPQEAASTPGQQG